MYKRGKFIVESNSALCEGIYRMTLSGNTEYIKAAGEFVNIELSGKYLRRPISVCDVEEGLLTIVYKIFGDGTKQMSEMSVGTELDILTGLGNGFSLDNNSQRPLLVGGGVGIPPLYNLAKRLIAKGVKPTLLLGFNTASQAFLIDELAALGVDIVTTTVDGSMGVKGLITAALPTIDFDYTYSCGPIPMLKALSDATECSGEFSFEERMGCGFGACVGCTCKTKYGYKRICKDGPVLKKEEIVW